MDIVKYQLAVALKNWVASIPEHGIPNVADCEVEYGIEDNLSAMITVRRKGHIRRDFEFRLKEIR